jgi:hypothetical protein
MRKRICPYEKKVVEALKAKNLSLEINEHISTCKSCKNAALVSDWMNLYRERSWSTEMTEKILPEPDAIWNRAHTRRRPDRTLVKKALRPLIYPQVLSFVTVSIGVFLFLISNAEKIGNIFDSRIIAKILPIFLIPMLVVLISMAFCALVSAFEKRKETV